MQLDTGAENLFCLIKLRAHFKNINPKLNTDQGNLPFKIRNKQKWTPKDTQHNISAILNLAQNDLNKEKTKKKSKGQKKEVEEVAKKKDIIIANADKGGDVVIMNVGKYINKANR